ncbi:MAG: hypothetical protein FWB86_02760 [Treponema sp.]|nr:hypothetical protein [Treponema sp.]MCL2251691.1 hypothetical protein [Treponema sp.]
MKKKQVVTREYKPRYKKATKKEKKALLDELVKLTSYHRKSAVRALRANTTMQVMIYMDGKAVKNQTGKKTFCEPKGETRLYRRSDLLPASYLDILLV